MTLKKQESMFSYSTVTSVFLAVTCSWSKPPFVASAVLSLQDVFLFASQNSSFSDQSGPLSVSSHINSLRTHHTPYSETAHSCHHSNSTNSRRKHCEPLGPQAKTWGTPIAWETQKTALSPQRERRTLTEVFCPPPFNYNSVCSAVLPLTLYAAQPQS